MPFRNIKLNLPSATFREANPSARLPRPSAAWTLCIFQRIISIANIPTAPEEKTESHLKIPPAGKKEKHRPKAPILGFQPWVFWDCNKAGWMKPRYFWCPPDETQHPTLPRGPWQLRIVGALRHALGPVGRSLHRYTDPWMVDFYGKCWNVDGILCKIVDLHVPYRIHVWYIYLHLVDSCGKFVGKYTVRPMDPSWGLKRSNLGVNGNLFKRGCGLNILDEKHHTLGHLRWKERVVHYERTQFKVQIMTCFFKYLLSYRNPIGSRLLFQSHHFSGANCHVKLRARNTPKTLVHFLVCSRWHPQRDDWWLVETNFWMLHILTNAHLKPN